MFQIWNVSITGSSKDIRADGYFSSNYSLLWGQMFSTRYYRETINNNGIDVRHHLHLINTIIACDAVNFSLQQNYFPLEVS
mmetsp:Transcript_26855/g.53635  ORF Transcript_26855/g.53635 Transcript_26855/m.53635 type:complete len:81 (-) Transcript_26855:306-548(-)